MLYEQLVKRDIKVYEEFFAGQLVEHEGRCQGVIAWDLLHGGLKALGGKTVLLATGGVGRLYRATTNAYACTGDGMSMALRAGLPLKAIEFMQFHPTTMYPSGILITEGCRGEGGILRNSEGERFMVRYVLDGEGPRRRATSSPARSRPRSTRDAASTARCSST